MNFSEIASAVGGFFVLVYAIWQVIIKFCGDKDWFAKRRKQKQLELEEQRTKSLHKAISDAVSPLAEDLKEIKERNKTQDDVLEKLVHSSNDMMRAEIVKIYYRYLPHHKMLQYSRELLEKLFHDYHDQGGNSFIENLYNEMITWPVVRTEEDLRK